MRIVLTGAGGGLGRAFLAAAPSHHDVISLGHVELDIGDHHAVMAAIPALAPDLVLNTAAFTAVDANETDPARAFRDNAQGPHSLAVHSGVAEVNREAAGLKPVLSEGAQEKRRKLFHVYGPGYGRGRRPRGSTIAWGPRPSCRISRSGCCRSH